MPRNFKRKAIFLLYRALQAIVSPLLLLYLLSRGLRDRRYFATFRERCGFLPPSWQQTVSASIWLHAVSVGEVLAAAPLIQEIRQLNPGVPVFLSTTTLAGYETARKRLDGVVQGTFFAPLDYVWAVRRVLRRLRPTVVVILETEIWPNLFREARRSGCGLMIVNGRISDRALSRYRRFHWFFSGVLPLCDVILAQSEEMRQRFITAGAVVDSVEDRGNLKYDFTPVNPAPDSPAMQFVNGGAKGAPLWIAASTSEDDTLVEESFVIEAQRRLAHWRLIIAPRKPERFDKVAALLEASGLRWTRRSLSLDPALFNPSADVLLLDSIGELSGLFASAKVVFMGGTLANRGGHNILEPASFGKPVIVGPHLENFRDIEEHFEKHNALLRIDSGARLGDAVIEASEDAALGPLARLAASRKTGAAALTASRVMALYDTRYPRERLPEPVNGLLWALSYGWKWGSSRNRKSRRKRVQRLPVPVISVGNITAGGTGKTPLTIELLRELRDLKPGLLIRGHGRESRANVLFLKPLSVPVSLTGDEAQLAMQGAGVPIGIGGNRFQVGQQLLDATSVRLLVLDDGFQHLQLVRDFNLVAVDALRPFGGGHLIPLGRLREPLRGLRRADAFVITRADEVPNTRAIAEVLRRHNPKAPVFESRVRPEGWRGPDGNLYGLEEMASIPAVAFCALGNPDSFWRTLRRMGIQPLERITWPDHHRYVAPEARTLARNAARAGAEVLLTTAKDAVNLDAECRAALERVPLYSLEIGLEIDRRDELMELMATKARLTLIPRLGNARP